MVWSRQTIWSQHMDPIICRFLLPIFTSDNLHRLEWRLFPAIRVPVESHGCTAQISIRRYRNIQNRNREESDRSLIKLTSDDWSFNVKVYPIYRIFQLSVETFEKFTGCPFLFKQRITPNCTFDDPVKFLRNGWFLVKNDDLEFAGKNDVPVVRNIFFELNVDRIEWESWLFRGKFSPSTVASFLMLCIENSRERTEARPITMRKGRTRAQFCSSEGVVNKRYSRACYPILRLLSFGIC